MGCTKVAPVSVAKGDGSDVPKEWEVGMSGEEDSVMGSRPKLLPLPPLGLFMKTKLIYKYRHKYTTYYLYIMKL